jgi:inosine-uridine nucleoside N-ribohydrolase
VARPKAIVDCDPGHDDAVAILLAARHFDLLGVTTVGGNAPIDNVTTNALKVLELAGLARIPVARGMERPLVRELRTGARIHGASGLDGVELPVPVTPLHPQRGVEFLIDTLMANEGVTLFPVGPLTNVATALRLEPRIRERIGQVSLMGGSATWGNVTPAAEFNIACDPEAAHIVFTSGVPLTMCGLDLTRQADAGVAEVARISALGTRTATVVADLLEAYRQASFAVHGTPSVPLHDPCAVAAIVEPGLFEFFETHVAVETRGQHTMGMTVVDRRYAGTANPRELAAAAGVPPANCRVAVRIDKAGFFDLVCEALATYP